MMTVSLGSVSISSEYLTFREWLKPAVSALVGLVPSSDRAPALPGFSLMRLVDALHLFHEHWLRSICSKQLSGLEIMILVHQFSNAENKLLLWLWVSHSRGKWKQESEMVFLY